MSFGYESTNCALLSRCRLDDIIQLNTPPRVLQRLAEGKKHHNCCCKASWCAASARLTALSAIDSQC